MDRFDIFNKLTAIGEYSAAGLYEEADAPRFRRQARAIRRYWEACPLAPYEGKKLYPSGVLPVNASCRPNYLTGLSIDYQTLKVHDPALSDAIMADIGYYQSTVPVEHTVAGNLYTHSMPNYARIARDGLDSYAGRISAMQDETLRLGLTDLLEGIRVYHRRCLAFLTENGADEVLLQAFSHVPFSPAGNLYEALLCWNFILYLDNCDNLGSLVTGLAPFYRGEDVTEILENLFDNLDLNGGYSMSLHTDYSPLTLQCLAAVKGKRRPMIELFVNQNTPKEVWKAAFDSIRTGNGQPAFYSEKHLDLLEKRFPSVRPEDRHFFCGGGCAESMYGGLSNVGSLDAGINLLLIYEEVAKKHLSSCPDFESFYRILIREIESVSERVTAEIRKSQLWRREHFPLPMRTLLIDDCIDRETEYNAGGARYCWSIVNFAGMINLADALLFIREHIYLKKDMTAEELLSRCAANDRIFLSVCQNAPLRFGNDNPEANSFVKKLSEDIFSTLDGKKTAYGDGFIPASIQFMSQVAAGKGIGATPDGRSCGSPLCDSLGAIFGKDDRGPTALLRSVTSLRLDLLTGTPILNFNITPDFSDEVLTAMILGYQSLGGLQMQITCADRKTLLEAYENPELHRNLVVRVGGYSEYFRNLSDELKRMVIDRTIQSVTEPD